LGGAFGLGVGGITGVEVAGFYDHDYPLVAKQPRAFPHYFFYEFGRNYFLFGDRHSLFATGFAVAMRYVCMDATGCEDADIKTRQWIERFESQFAGSQVPFGQAFVQFGAKNNIQLRDIDGSPFEYSDLTILYASIVLRLRKEHGGDDWTTRFYEHIYDCLPSAPATPEGATGQLVNWVVSSSLAARKDLTPLFVERWRFPISPELQRALAAVDWAKKDMTARAVFESLPTGVLPGRLAVRLPAFLTAERKKQNLLTDGSFETAAGNDWSASTWRNNPQAVTRVDGGREGQRAVQIRTTVADDVQYRQRVSVKPQTRYLLSGWIKTQGVQIVEKGGSQGANLSLDGTWEATAPVLGDTDWTYVTLEFDSGPRTEVAVAARLGFFYSTATGTAWYDDLCLIEIDQQNSRGDKPEAARATALGDKAAGRGVKLLGMTVVDPTQELLHQYGLPEQYPGPIIVQQMDRSPYWASFGSPPGEGCAFWLIQDPGHQFLFNQERSPSYTPKTVRELTTAILACAASPDEYQKMWDAMRQQCRENAEKVKDNPEQRERILKAAEATMPKEDVGKHICRVVYHFPKGEGTMTTYLRLGKEDVEQLRALLNSPFSGKPK
jgi:hypothetical protein